MAMVTRMNPEKSPAGRRPVWQEVAFRFSEPRECLASFLALEAAEVLDGAKPANLVAVSNRRRSCGRNLYTLWKEWGGAVLAGSGLAARELSDRGDSVLLLLYSQSALDALLRRPDAAAVLKRAGYADVAAPERVLDELASRFSRGGFPHEIGVFLGYPLKDVAAFIGWVRIPSPARGRGRSMATPGKASALLRGSVVAANGWRSA